MKKILALILVVCLALSCFVGCKDDKDTKATKKPATTTSAPATDAPTTDEPTTDEPTTDEPTTDEPTTDEPTTDEPTTDEPTTDEPTTDEPTTDEPTTDEPATGDWEMPDNSDIDCLAFDFRTGETGFFDVTEGWMYTAAGAGLGGGVPANTAEINGVDPNGANPGYLTVSIGSVDDYFYLYDFDSWTLKDYPIVKIVLRNTTPDSGFEFFLFEQGAACSGNITMTGISTEDTSFKTYYVDLRASGASNTLSVDAHGMNLGTKEFSALRVDFPASEGKPGANFDIQYIGFFSSLDEAKAYK